MEETIGELAAALNAGRLTSRALVQRCLARIAALDGRFNSFVALDEAGALAAARESDARLARAAPRSLLEGVPLSIKDNIHAAGLPSTWGSRALADYRPDIDELPVARLRAAGAIILGKTNVPELTLEGFPAILTDFETIGTLTRTVDDALTLDSVLAGSDARDRRSLYAAAPPWAVERPRIIYIPKFGEGPVDPEVARIVADFARTLEREGHVVKEAPVFFDLEDAARIWHVVSRAGVAWLMQWNGARLEDGAGASARAMAADGRKLAAADYTDALERAGALRRRCAELFANAELVLTPTAAALPWPAETPFPDTIAGRKAGPRDHAIFTGWVNIAGLPAISLPIGLAESGLPVGVQLAAGFGADSALLAFARDASRRHKPPPLPIMDPSS